MNKTIINKLLIQLDELVDMNVPEFPTVLHYQYLIDKLNNIVNEMEEDQRFKKLEELVTAKTWELEALIYEDRKNINIEEICKSIDKIIIVVSRIEPLLKKF